MRNTISILAAGFLLAFAVQASAQGNGAKPKNQPKRDVISQADTDGDGKVSRDEFLAFERSRAEKIFDRLDANKDGAVDKKELAKSRKERRAKSGSPQGGNGRGAAQ